LEIINSKFQHTKLENTQEEGGKKKKKNTCSTLISYLNKKKPEEWNLNVSVVFLCDVAEVVIMIHKPI
jgi:hypothetical protein